MWFAATPAAGYLKTIPGFGMDHSLRLTIRPAIADLALTATRAAYIRKVWPTFGHDPMGTRYSTLKRIDARNVIKLLRVLTYRMDASAPAALASSSTAGRGRRGGGNSKAVALDAVTDCGPATGGLEFRAGDRQSPAPFFLGASSSELIALHAMSGKSMPDLV